jgi:hypothetical protein
MERNELIKILVESGFSEKTLIWFNDKQLLTLHNTLSEQQPMKGAVIMKKQTTPPSEVKKVTDAGVNVELREKKNQPKKKKKKKESDVDEASRTLANGYHGGLKKMKYKAGRKDITCNEAPKTVKEWVESIVENKYHSLTTKNEIMELITTKLHESELSENNPQTAPKPNSPSPTTIPNPGTRPQKPKRENPFEPKHNPKPKAKVKLPEFMKFKNIGIRLKNPKKNDQ